MMGTFNHKNGVREDYHVISANEPSGIIAEQYRKLRTNIDFSTFNEELKVINMTSTFAAEGKTVTALNLATVYAQAEKKTLIIDMDLRKPKIHRAFNIVNANGLTDVITKNLSLDKAIVEAEPFLHVLPAGEKMPYPAEFLMSKKLKELVEKLKETYDKIIIDTPPMSAVTDASIVSKLTDGTALVVASRQTNSDAAESIVKTLKENGANIIGAILTRVSRKDHRYLDYYYKYEE